MSGREFVVVANDATVKGGTCKARMLKKLLRAREVAQNNRLPCVYVVDSSEALLQLPDEVFPDHEHVGSRASRPLQKVPRSRRPDGADDGKGRRS